MFGGPEENPSAKEWTIPPEQINGALDYYDLKDEDNYSQASIFWQQVLDDGAKERLVNNLAETINLANITIKRRAIEVFSEVHSELGNRLKLKLNVDTTVHL